MQAYKMFNNSVTVWFLYRPNIVNTSGILNDNKLLAVKLNY